jgi:CheY-like chemotaxis protein
VKLYVLGWVAILLCGLEPCRAGGSPSLTPANHTAGVSNVTLSGIDALEKVVKDEEQTVSNQIARTTQKAQAQADDDEPPPLSTTAVILSIVGFLAGILVIRKLAPRLGEFLNDRFHPWDAATKAADDAGVMDSFSKFAEIFSSTSSTHPPKPAPSPSNENLADSLLLTVTGGRQESQTDPVAHFLDTAPKDLGAIRRLFSDLSREPREPVRQQHLGEMAAQLKLFQNKASSPALLPVWQTASAVEGLVSQLSAKPGTATPSALRTVASALDLLSSMVGQDLKPDLASDPPVHLLAVDDDPISRHALSFALKKVFSEPDLAVDGESALLLAEQRYYDVIFLDVEMPGMDGFELCARVHGTAPNHTTPVVFVTSHNDFNSRATSLLTGGQDLIGKPFLPFELAVKALTLVFLRRLQATGAGAGLRPPAQSPHPLPARFDPPAPADSHAEAADGNGNGRPAASDKTARRGVKQTVG